MKKSRVPRSKTRSFFPAVKKTLLSLTLAGSLAVLSSVGALAANTEATAVLDGKTLPTKGVVGSSLIYVPVRAACEALGYSVAWSDAGGVKTITLTKESDTIVFDLSGETVNDNGHSYYASSHADNYGGTGIELISGSAYLDSELFGEVFSVGTSFDAASGSLKLTSRPVNAITIQNVKTAETKDYLKTTVQYPKISGLTDADAQSAINAAIKQLADTASAEGAQNASDMAQAVKEGYGGGVNMCETYFDYAVKYNRDGLLSIVFQDYQYSGGAHGGTLQTGLTFDLATGKMLKLNDLTNTSSGYRAYINASIRQSIDNRIASGNLTEFPDAKFSDIGDDPAFFLSNTGIVFYFQQYEYFPYAAGIQEFTIPYSELKDMLGRAYGFLYSEPVTLSAGSDNQLPVGTVGRVTLAGNPTTGFAWHAVIADPSVLSQVDAAYTPSAPDGAVGAGGTYTWDFKALKAGKTTITFKYYRDWEGDASATAQNTAVYAVTVG